MKKRLLLIQPGRTGDLFLCAGIAEYYHLNYKIYWPVRKEFMSTLKQFINVIPIELPEKFYHEDILKSDVLNIYREYDLHKDLDRVLNLADRGPHSTAEMPSENFEQCKYRKAMVPWKFKYNLSFYRSFERERTLFDEFVGKEEQEYVFAHLENSNKERARIPDTEKRKVVECKKIEGYTILDWYYVIVKSQAIYCIESAVHQFIDTVSGRLDIIKYLLRNESKPKVKWTISEKWNMEYFNGS